MKLIFLFIAFASAVQNSSATLNPDWAVVFPAETALTLLRQCSRVIPENVSAAWTPDEAIIRRFEKALGTALQTALNEELSKESYQQWAADFYRQYAGLEISGHQFVYANGFHRLLLREVPIKPTRPPVDWRHIAVNVCDGWTSYFGALFDPAADKIIQIRFNGRGFALRDNSRFGSFTAD